MSCVIQVEGLKKSYGNHNVLKGLTFGVEKGEIFGLLGVNGAGKTTALECIENLRKYDEGSISVNGSVGIQLQSSSLPDYIRPMEAVRLFAKWNRAKLDEAMLAALGIPELGKKHYVNLSTGQKRRLHLSLALIGNPDIVFLDEPTAGLDVEGRVSLHCQIRELKKRGKTIVLASHDMAEVESLCDHITILRDGNIAFWGTVSQLEQKAGKKYSILIKTETEEVKHEADNIGDALLALLEEYKKTGVPVLDIKIDRGTLEQQFIEIAGRNDQ